jgi:hypothetical protein
MSGELTMTVPNSACTGAARVVSHDAVLFTLMVLYQRAAGDADVRLLCGKLEGDFMLSRKSSVTSFLFILCVSVGYAQTASSTPGSETSFLRRSETLRLTTIDFRAYIPAGYDPAKKNIRSFFIFMEEALGVMTMRSR